MGALLVPQQVKGQIVGASSLFHHVGPGAWGLNLVIRLGGKHLIHKTILLAHKYYNWISFHLNVLRYGFTAALENIQAIQNGFLAYLLKFYTGFW